MKEKREVLKEILTSEDIVYSIKNNKSILLNIIPELNATLNFDQKHPHHHLDVFNHTLLALSLSLNDFEIRLCLLLHDIGKPHSYQDGDVRHFKGHTLKSSQMAFSILKNLEYDYNFIEEVCYLVKMHDTPLTLEEIKSNYNLSYKRFLIQYCDCLAHNPLKLDKRIKYLKETTKLFKENYKEFNELEISDDIVKERNQLVLK